MRRLVAWRRQAIARRSGGPASLARSTSKLLPASFRAAGRGGFDRRHLNGLGVAQSRSRWLGRSRLWRYRESQVRRTRVVPPGVV
jgi:hypothetical protein